MGSTRSTPAGDIQLADELAHRREQHLAPAGGGADDEEIVAAAGDEIDNLAQRLAVDVNDLQANDIVQVELVGGRGACARPRESRV